MKRSACVLVLAAAALLAQSADAVAQRRARSDPAPVRVGSCALTRIASVHQRLEDGTTHRELAGSGSAVEFANRLYQVSYEQVAAVNESRRGDPVYICLMKLPTHCPPGDTRGKLYTTTNLRTEQSWTLGDSQHMCGGA